MLLYLTIVVENRFKKMSWTFVFWWNRLTRINFCGAVSMTPNVVSGEARTLVSVCNYSIRFSWFVEWLARKVTEINRSIDDSIAVFINIHEPYIVEIREKITPHSTMAPQHLHLRELLVRTTILLTSLPIFFITSMPGERWKKD